MMSDALRAVILGIIEGVTEFLPVSSTGHLLLAERFFNLGEGSFWNSFTVLIQLGAILAILVIYFVKLWRVALGMFSNPDDRRFVIGVLVAFLPAVVIGLIAGKYIKEFLFNPWVVCFSLIVGGAILLWVDQLDHNPHEHDATKFPLLMYLAIGFAQCLAMIPGVSRSGASIVAAMLLGADKRAAAEFSFFLAIPTMVGAFAYDFYKNRGEMNADHLGIVAIGFVVSFVTAIVVVKTFLSLRHPQRLYAVRLVARHRRHARPDRAGDGKVATILMVRRRSCAVSNHDRACDRPSRRAQCALAALRTTVQRLTRSSSGIARWRGSARDIAARWLPANPA